MVEVICRVAVQSEITDDLGGSWCPSAHHLGWLSWSSQMIPYVLPTLP